MEWYIHINEQNRIRCTVGSEGIDYLCREEGFDYQLFGKGVNLELKKNSE